MPHDGLESAGRIQLGWSAPVRRVDAASARQAILHQHRRIRRLLEEARIVADAALDGESEPNAVAEAIGAIRSVMEMHLAFEEGVLLPLLRDDVPLGPERADELLDEHRRQRATLVGLHDEARAHPQLPTLAAKLAFLTSWLLEDMSEEERCLINPDVVRDDNVVVDQSSG